MTCSSNHLRAGLAALVLVVPSALAGSPAAAQEPVAAAQDSYADIAALAESSELVVLAQVAKLLRVEPERAPGVRAGHGRFYVVARTRSLLSGNSAIGESITYLVDLPLDGRGKPPALRKQDVFLFARSVPGRPDQLRLVTPTAQRPWSAPADARIRAVLKALVSPDAPARVTGVRELLHVPGNLAGQGETQIFLSTATGSAASITVRHEAGGGVAWGVSFSELVADLGHPPARDTLEWYRLACFLPNRLPPTANVSEGIAAKRQAEADYRMVLGELGVCDRRGG